METNPNNAADELANKLEPFEKAAHETAAAVREESKHLLCCTSDYVRKNPISSLFGAMVFGVAVGCLIMSGRPAPTLQQRYIKEPLDQASDVLTKVSEHLGGLAANLKFW